MQTSAESKAIKILTKVRDCFPNGIRESKLPHQDDLVMHRLTNRNFLRATDVLETGESIFEITEEGIKEAQRGRDH